MRLFCHPNTLWPTSLVDWLVFFALLALQIVPMAVGADRVPRKNKPLQFPFQMMDGGLLGTYQVEDAITAKPSGPPPPKFYIVHYFWDGTHLRVRPRDGDK